MYTTLALCGFLLAVANAGIIWDEEGHKQNIADGKAEVLDSTAIAVMEEVRDALAGTLTVEQSALIAAVDLVATAVDDLGTTGITVDQSTLIVAVDAVTTAVEDLGTTSLTVDQSTLIVAVDAVTTAVEGISTPTWSLNTITTAVTDGFTSFDDAPANFTTPLTDNGFTPVIDTSTVTKCTLSGVVYAEENAQFDIYALYSPLFPTSHAIQTGLSITFTNGQPVYYHFDCPMKAYVFGISGAFHANTYLVVTGTA